MCGDAAVFGGEVKLSELGSFGGLRTSLWDFRDGRIGTRSASVPLVPLSASRVNKDCGELKCGEQAERSRYATLSPWN